MACGFLLCAAICACTGAGSLASDCADLKGTLDCNSGRCPAADCGSCNNTADCRSAPCPEPDCSSAKEVVPDPCAACPEAGYCKAGHCYDCSEEGFCNAVECQDDGNPCTLEEIDPETGACASVVNPACEEPMRNMLRIFRGASAYYGTWACDPDTKTCEARKPKLGKPLAMEQGYSPEAGTCCGAEGGPDKNGDGFCDADAAPFRSPVWKVLGFHLDGVHRYSYSFVQTGTGALGEEMFTIFARADLDCDGKVGEWVLKGSFKADGLISLATAIGMLPVAEPKEFEYLPEDGSGTEAVSAAWAVEQFWEPASAGHDSGQTGGPDASPTTMASVPTHAESLYGRLDEPIRHFVRLHEGALRFYRVPKAQVGAPACQVTSSVEAAKYMKHLPMYTPLHSGGWFPVEQACCASLWGKDQNEDGLCDRDPDMWELDPWASLGFVILGQHAWWYQFKELPVGFDPAAGADTFGFRIDAMTNEQCDPVASRVSLQQTVFPVGGKCEVPDTHDWFVLLPDMEYFPVAELDSSIVLPLGGIRWGQMLGNDLWHGVNWSEGEGIPNHDARVVLFEPMSSLQHIANGISSYYEAHCGLPALPDWTPSTSDCCDYDAYDSLKSECQGNPESWNHEFWTAIGFRMVVPHHYVYRVTSTAIEGDQFLITAEAKADLNCSFGAGSTIRRFGVASAGAGGCAVTWIEGYDTKNLFQ